MLSLSLLMATASLEMLLMASSKAMVSSLSAAKEHTKATSIRVNSQAKEDSITLTIPGTKELGKIRRCMAKEYIRTPLVSKYMKETLKMVYCTGLVF